MRAPNLLERILNFFQYELKTYFCRHATVKLYCRSNELFEGYGDYAGYCDKCGKDLRVIIEAPQKGE